MNKSQAEESIKKLHAVSAEATPTSVVNLFEIDISDIALDELLYKNKNIVPTNSETVFRFHNNIKISQNSIWFAGQEYIAAPIRVEGYETSSKGTLPQPKMSISANEQGIHNFHLLKQYIRALDSIIGAKVTRIRTFSRYLDKKNFYDNNDDLLHPDVIVPEGFDPDENAHFPPEIYFVERKSTETKLFIEFELSSALEIENIKLPARLVTQNSCMFAYRGEGCCYEYAGNLSEDIHGEATLPTVAPPLANEKDERIEEAIDEYSPTDYHGNVPPLWKGSADNGSGYAKGKAVRIKVKGVNYYFVAKDTVPVDAPPPNDRYWMSDQCSKKITGCRLRWGTYAASPDGDYVEGSPPVTAGGDPKNKTLPFGAFPGVTTAADSLR